MATSGSSPRSGLVLELAEEFLERYRNGQRPPLREYTERHPELADEIREVFPAMAMMERIAIADESLEGDPTGDALALRGRLPERLGDYRILREVGRGGMGVVYEAEQVSLGRHVALKVLPARMVGDEKTRRRFEREAKAAAKLHHTNIVPVFGVGEDGDTPYYVMQFIRGQGLDAVLEELKRLRASDGDGARVATPVAPETHAAQDFTAAEVARSLLTAQHTPGHSGPPATEPTPARGEDDPSGIRSDSSLSLPGVATRGKAQRESYWQGVARIAYQAADALAHAHDQGIVHRDIKPSNLLLDATGTVWITDFGLAKANDQQDLTHTGDVLGTLRYMPPEAFGGKVDARGDVYSLGLSLYELLAFRPAFDERDRGRLVRQVTNESPPPLRKLNPEVPRDLETIVQKAIERDPAHRYGSASELADDLRRFLDDEPIRARRLSPAERLARWGRRNPVIAGLSAALVLTLVAGTIGSTLFARRAGEQARRATRALTAEAAARREVETTNVSLAATRDELRITLHDARMNLAQAAWDADNLDSLATVLEQARPRAGEPDPRGFEWYYWGRRLRGEARVLPMADGWPPKSPDSLTELAPDGGAVVAVSGFSSGQWEFNVWDTATGKNRWRARSPTPRADRNVPTIAFSGDGGRLAVGWRSASAWHARVLDVASGHEVFSWSESYQTPARTPGYFTVPVALSADGRRLALIVGSEATASSEPTSSRLLAWDVPQRAARLNVKLPDDSVHPADSLVFTPDGDTLVETPINRRGPFETTLRTWDVARGTARDSVHLPGLRSVVTSVRPDGRRVIVMGVTTAFQSMVAKLLDPVGLREVGSFSVAGENNNSGRIFSPDGRRLVFTYFQSHLVRIVDAETGGLTREFKHPRAVHGARFSRDGRGLVTLDSDQVIRAWDLDDLDPARDRSRLDLADVESVVLSPDATRLVAVGGGRGPLDAEMTMLDVASRTPLWRAPRRTNMYPDPPVFSPDGSRLGAWVRMGTPLPGPVRIAAGLPRPEEIGGLGILYERKGDSWVVTRVVPGAAADRDGRIRPGDTLLAAGPADGPQVELSDRPGAVVHRLLSRPVGTPVRLTVRARASERPTSCVLTSAPLPSDSLAAIPERIFLVRDAATGRELVAVPPGRNHDGGTVATFRPDGREIALGVIETPDDARFDDPGRPLARIHDASGRWLRDLAFPADEGRTFLRELVYSPDGRLLAAAVGRAAGAAATRAPSSYVAVWEVATGRLAHDFRPPTGDRICHAATFSPDGSALAASFSDDAMSGPGTVLVWDLPSGEVRRRLGSLPRHAQGLVFAPDGRRLLTVTSTSRPTAALGQELKLWDMTSGRDLLTISAGRLHANPRFTADGRHLIAVDRGASPLQPGARLVVWDGSEPDGPVPPSLSATSPRP